MKRETMRRVVLIVLAVLGLSAQSAQSQSRSLPAFEVDRAWPKMPPQWKLGDPSSFSDPGPGQFSIVHAIGVANVGTVSVDDRERRRVQSFTKEGKFLKQLDPADSNRLSAAASASNTQNAAAAIRLRGSQRNIRWDSPLGRVLTELAILTAAREHDQPYEWSLHEMEAIAVGLNPAVIDVVRHRKALTGVAEKESTLIQIGREIFGTHRLSSETYARALRLFGETNLIDLMDLMANYAATATRLTAFNQQLPPGWKQFLPLPFTPPDDIHPDSRSRLPLIRSQSPTPAATPALYSRTLAPEGTGPAQIRRHGAGLKSLESGVGRRLMGLAILLTAREHDAQYQWTMNEPVAIQDGLEPSIIALVRDRKPLSGLAERDAALIEFARELFGKHNVSRQTYARALKVFGERDLVDLVDLMAQQTADSVLLAAFDQQLPVGQKPLLGIR